jgi:hypothetical protein
MFRYHYSQVFPVAEFAKIPRIGPVAAGQRGGNIGMFRYHYSQVFPVAEFAKIPPLWFGAVGPPHPAGSSAAPNPVESGSLT